MHSVALDATYIGVLYGLTAAHPESCFSYQAPSPLPVVSLPQSERDIIGRALAATSGEKGRAARLLHIGRTTLYRKMKQYGME